MHEYLGLFKRKDRQTASVMHAAPSGQPDAFQQIPQSELAGLVGWIQLVEIIAKNVKFLEFLKLALRCFIWYYF